MGLWKMKQAVELKKKDYFDWLKRDKENKENRAAKDKGKGK